MSNSESVSINSDVIETVIGSKTKFKGSVETDKLIRIEGQYEGIINSSSKVIIAEGGFFDGQLKCAELKLIGEARGTIKCTDLLEFALSGKFKGDACTANVDIHPGSDFDGNLKIEK